MVPQRQVRPPGLDVRGGPQPGRKRRNEEGVDPPGRRGPPHQQQKRSTARPDSGAVERCCRDTTMAFESSGNRRRHRTFWSFWRLAGPKQPAERPPRLSATGISGAHKHQGRYASLAFVSGATGRRSQTPGRFPRPATQAHLRPNLSMQEVCHSVTSWWLRPLAPPRQPPVLRGWRAGRRPSPPTRRHRAPAGVRSRRSRHRSGRTRPRP